MASLTPSSPSRSFVVHLLPACMLALLLAACGGSGGDAGSPGAGSRPTELRFSALDDGNPQPMAVVAMSWVGDEAVAPGRWRTTFRIGLHNNGADALGVQVRLLQPPPGGRIVDGQAGIPLMRTGARWAMLADTITLEHDEPGLPSPHVLRWAVTADAVRTVPELDPTLPPEVAASVVEVVSADGRGAPGAWLRLPVLPADEAPTLMATDAAGRVRLMGYGGTGRSVLGVESTASAAAGLMLASIDPAWRGQAAQAALRASPAWPTLLQAVDAGVRAGRALQADPAVTAALASVVADTVPRLPATAPARPAPQAGQAAARERERAALLHQPRVQRLPHTVYRWPAVPVAQPVDIVDGTGDALWLRNAMLITWEAQVLHPVSGQLLGRALLPGLRGLPLLPSQVEAAVPTRVTVPAQHGFNLRLTQSADAQRASFIESAAAAVGAALAQMPAAACSEQALKTLFEAALDPAVDVRLLDPAALLRKQFEPRNGISVVAGLVERCANARVSPGWVLFAKLTGDLLSFWTHTEAVLRVGAVPSRLLLMLQHRSVEPQVGVCRDALGLVGSCVVSFDWARPERAVMPGVALDVLDGLRPRDGDGRVTSRPPDLRWSADVPTLLSLPGEEGVSVALAPGTTLLRVQDAATGATGALSVVVVGAPQVAPAHPVMAPGEQLTFRLVDAEGRQVQPPSPATWTLEQGADEPLAGPDPTLPLGDAGQATFRALRPGVATVHLREPVHGRQASTTVTVAHRVGGSVDGTAGMAYRYCSGVTMQVSGPWQLTFEGERAWFDFSAGLTQAIRAQPCFTNVAVFNSAIELPRVPGSAGRYRGQRSYPFVGEGGVAASTDVSVDVTRADDGTVSGTLVWHHHNASLVGTVTMGLSAGGR